MPENTVISHNLVISHNTTLVHNAFYPSAAQRRDAAVIILKTLSDRVKSTDVLELLLSFGGADPDQVVKNISDLYIQDGISVYLQDAPKNTMGAPGLIYSVLTSYGHSTVNEIVHYRNLADRETHLRNRLIDFGEAGIAAHVSHDYLATKLQEAMKSETTANFPASIHLLTSLAEGWTLS